MDTLATRIPRQLYEQITRDVAPAAQGACIDTVNRTVGKLGGAVVTGVRVENGVAFVQARTLEGTLYDCRGFSPAATIPYGFAAANASAG